MREARRRRSVRSPVQATACSTLAGARRRQEHCWSIQPVRAIPITAEPYGTVIAASMSGPPMRASGSPSSTYRPVWSAVPRDADGVAACRSARIADPRRTEQKGGPRRQRPRRSVDPFGILLALPFLLLALVPGTAVAQTHALGGTIFLATVMTGAEEAPGPGDPDGIGAAVFALTASTRPSLLGLHGRAGRAHHRRPHPRRPAGLPRRRGSAPRGVRATSRTRRAAPPSPRPSWRPSWPTRPPTT